MHMLVGRVSPLDQFALFLHGLLFAILAQRSRSLWPGVIIHFVYNGLTSLVWSGSSSTALLAFDGSLGWTKWAFKAAMVVPYLLLVWYIYRKPQRTALS
jgi:membrane protease YdiL (CAAX protease family)